METVLSEEVTARKKYFVQKCRENRVQCTPQRIAVFDFLATTDSHPTAINVFSIVSQKIPTLSLANTYKILERFTKIGVVKKFDFGEGGARFDARIDQHHHVLEQDGSIHDVFLDADIPLPKGFVSCDFSEVSITFRR